MQPSQAADSRPTSDQRLGGISRRTALGVGAAAGVAAIAAGGRTAMAQNLAGGGGRSLQGGGYYRTDVGDIAVFVVSDGNMPLDAPYPLYGRNVGEQAVMAEIEHNLLPKEETVAQCNALALRVRDRTMLIDTGCRDIFGPTAGALPAHLAAAGIDPGEISDIIITHAHPDHVAGLRDTNGRENFPEARVHISRIEADFWNGATPADLDGTGASAQMRPMLIDVARSVTGLPADRLSLLDDGDEAAPGVTVRLTPGHTPGHLSVVIEDGGERLMFMGDAITHEVFSFREPDFWFAFDSDPEQAVRTRRDLLGELADAGDRFVATHTSFPGVSRVVREGASFRSITEPFDWRRG